jgi:hypothetical protein
MSQSWTISMGDYPAGFDNARLLVATFLGMSMVVACDSFDTTFTVMLEADDGTCPVEVTPASFASVAVSCAAVRKQPRKPLIVLQRRDVDRPFSFVQFADADEASVLLQQAQREAHE